jgi:hypothetical protein
MILREARKILNRYAGGRDGEIFLVDGNPVIATWAGVYIAKNYKKRIPSQRYIKGLMTTHEEVYEGIFEPDGKGPVIVIKKGKHVFPWKDEKDTAYVLNPPWKKTELDYFVQQFELRELLDKMGDKKRGHSNETYDAFFA